MENDEYIIEIKRQMDNLMTHCGRCEAMLQAHKWDIKELQEKVEALQDASGSTSRG